MTTANAETEPRTPHPAASDKAHSDWSVLTDKLLELRSHMLESEARFEEDLGHIAPAQQPSARNLLHYVSLRRHDLRPLQEDLVHHGLSSLGRCEAHVLDNLNSVLRITSQFSEVEMPPVESQAIEYRQARSLGHTRTVELLGPKPGKRGAHIMVTMPSEAAAQYSLVCDLLKAGMTAMRINCAHDDETAWRAMIENLRRAEKDLGQTCRVMMDLGGPKIRTGPIEPGPQVVHWRPHRDTYGRTLAPARLWLTDDLESHPPAAPADACVPIEAGFLSALAVGDEIRLRDTREQARRLKITGQSPGGFWAECEQTTYLSPEIELEHTPADASRTPQAPGRLGEIPPRQQFLIVYRGDRLLVTDCGKIGAPARYDDRGKLLERATIGCTLPEIFQAVREGDRILFDDGKIGGVIEQVTPGHLVVEITRARDNGEKLRADKGINLPDTQLALPALTEKDRQDLAFIAKHADAVSYSFVRRREDVYELQAELARIGRADMPIILKIENRQAAQRIARLLLAAMRSPVAGVMIARGDLAVECGWERLAELQEEILWMCEAAHVPVIWATQVLESLAKKGIPSRAEVTDAAMGVRAECVMLNKGPHIVETVRSLDDILRRMQDHQVKKRPMMRKLSLADDLLPISE